MMRLGQAPLGGTVDGQDPSGGDAALHDRRIVVVLSIQTCAMARSVFGGGEAYAVSAARGVVQALGESLVWRRALFVSDCVNFVDDDVSTEQEARLFARSRGYTETRRLDARCVEGGPAWRVRSWAKCIAVRIAVRTAA